MKPSVESGVLEQRVRSNPSMTVQVSRSGYFNRQSPLYLQMRKILRSYPEWHFAPPRVQVQTNLITLGSEHASYRLDPARVRRDSIVYSLGIGEDISFDLALIGQFGLQIHAFDPTPRVGEWLRSQNVPGQFHFYNQGIADFDGEVDFHLPPRKEFVSHSILAAKEYSAEAIRAPMIRLRTAMKNLGHDRIDLLKVDIEGAEYGLIEDIVNENISVEQILIEFHHRLSSVGTTKTRRALRLLESRGIKISYVCPRFQVFTMVRDLPEFPPPSEL
jgi:FkbM family methyltransferase